MSGDAARRVLRTFIIAFLFVLIPGALDWLHAVTDWANDGGQAAFPPARSLAFVGISAVTAGFIAVGNWIVVAVEDWSGHGLLRTPPSRPDRGQLGAISQRTVHLILAVVLVAFLLWIIFGVAL